MYAYFVGLAAVYASACIVAGFMRPSDNLATFVPSVGPIERSFANDVDAVRTAYRQAIVRTPGMRLLSGSDEATLIDLRPTSRIMSENFGMVIRLRYSTESPGVTRVSMDARRKVKFALGMDTKGALSHAERQLRMNAKAHGVSEVL